MPGNAAALTSNHIISIGDGASLQVANGASYPYNFEVVPDLVTLGKFIAANFKEKGYKKVGLLMSNDALGDSDLQNYKTALTADGISVSSVQYQDSRSTTPPPS